MSKYRSTWHLLPEQTYAFDYYFTLSMPSYKVTGDGDSFKEYEGTIKATGKDAKEAKEKAEKELQKRIDAAEKSTKGSLEDPFNSILDQGRAISEGLEEFTLVHTVRYLDPKNGKRFAAPYKTKEKAQEKMAQLKRDGVKDIEITQDTLRGNIKFKEGVINEDTPNERLASLRAKQMMKQTKIRELDPSKDQDKIDIAKNDIENIEIRMKSIRDKMQKEMLELIDESIKSDDDYQAKKKALQDIQNDPKMRDPETKAALMRRKEKLEKDYAEFKSKNKIAASKEFEKDLAAEADLTKGQIKKVHKMADELPKKDFKDRYGDEKGDAVRYATATNIIKKKEGIKEMQQIDEKIKGIQTKSDKSGIPYGILKQVYNRGMAAWKGGHRPGTTPQQWAFARVNSFITKGKSYYTADADLAKKARGAKKKKK